MLKLCRAQTQVAVMLSMTGVPRAVEMHHDEAEALAAFPDRTGDTERVTTGAQGLPSGAGRPRPDQPTLKVSVSAGVPLRNTSTL